MSSSVLKKASIFHISNVVWDIIPDLCTDVRKRMTKSFYSNPLVWTFMQVQLAFENLKHRFDHLQSNIGIKCSDLK